MGLVLAQRSIALAPLKSTYDAKRNEAQRNNPSQDFMKRADFNHIYALKLITHDGDVPWTSAKSLYRLCDSAYIACHLIASSSRLSRKVPGLDAHELVGVAKSHISSSLTPGTVVDELSSTFSHNYSDIMDMQISYMENHWVGALASDTCHTSLPRLSTGGSIKV
jgi:hypothetical protein